MKTYIFQASGCLRKLHSRLHFGNRRGVFIILTALMLPIIFWFLGLALDYGMMTINASRLQNACDAAALAGASRILVSNGAAANGTLATSAAQNIGHLIFPELPAASFQVTPSNTTIRVNVSYTQTLPFASMGGYLPFHLFQSTMNKQATAERTPLTTVPGGGLVPLAMSTNDCASHANGNNFTLNLIRNNKDDFTDGTTVGLSFQSSNGKSPSKWQSNLENGCSDDTVNILTEKAEFNSINASLSNQSSRLLEAMNLRISEGRTTMAMVVCDPVAASNGNVGHTIKRIAMVQLVSAASGTITLKELSSLTFSAENINKANLAFGSIIETGAAVTRLYDDMDSQ